MTRNNRFQTTAYTGAVLFLPWWGRIVFDVGGMRLDSKLPALREHIRDRAVGVVDLVEKDKNTLTANGFFVDTPDGREVLALLEQDFPMQASVGIFLDTVEEIKEGSKASVNGSNFQGPGFIARTSHVREISFCSLGADSQTRVSIAASAGGQEMALELEWNYNPALRSEFADDFGCYLAWAKASAAGLAKIFKKKA